MNDILTNQVSNLEKKVALLSPNFKEMPYLALYLARSETYSQAMFDFLIAQGADVDQADAGGYGPLFGAIRRGEPGAFHALLDRKANVNARWKSNASTILGTLGQSLELPSMSFDAKKDALVKAGIAKNRWTASPLWATFKFGRPAMARELLARGADPLAEVLYVYDRESSTAKTPAYVTQSLFAVVVDHFTSSTISTSSVGDQNMSVFGRSDEVTPAEFAAGAAIWRAVSALPAKKQPKLTKKESSSLLAAILLGNLTTFKSNLATAEFNTLNFLPYAAAADQWEMVELVAKFNNDFDLGQPAFLAGDSFRQRQTLLSWCLINDLESSAKMLLDHGVPLPTTLGGVYYLGNYQVMSPLSYSIVSHQKPLTKFLLSQKVDPNDGTPLQYCVQDQSSREMLIQGGADPRALVPFAGTSFQIRHAVQRGLPRRCRGCGVLPWRWTPAQCLRRCRPTPWGRCESQPFDRCNSPQSGG